MNDVVMSVVGQVLQNRQGGLGQISQNEADVTGQNFRIKAGIADQSYRSGISMSRQIYQNGMITPGQSYQSGISRSGQSYQSGISTSGHDYQNGINRPNYQQKNKEKRLMVYDINPLLNKTSMKDMLEESMMKPFDNTVSDQNSRYFCFANLNQDKRLLKALEFPYLHGEAACIGYISTGNIRSLFEIADILEDMKIRDYNLKWSFAENQPLTFCAVGKEERMKNLSEKLNRIEPLKQGICISEKTGSVLRKYLNVTSMAVGTIEGKNYIELFPKVAAYFQTNKDEILECKIMGSYLFVMGEKESVEKALRALAGRE